MWENSLDDAEQYLQIPLIVVFCHYMISGWRRHDMETLYELLVYLCGESTGHQWIPCTKDQWWGIFMFSWLSTYTNCLTNSPVVRI